MGLTELVVKRGWSSAPRRLSPRFHRPALAEGSAPGTPPTGAPPPRPPLVVQYPSSLEGLALRSHHPASPCRSMCVPDPRLQSDALNTPRRAILLIRLLAGGQGRRVLSSEAKQRPAQKAAEEVRPPPESRRAREKALNGVCGGGTKVRPRIAKNAAAAWQASVRLVTVATHCLRWLLFS